MQNPLLIGQTEVCSECNAEDQIMCFELGIHLAIIYGFLFLLKLDHQTGASLVKLLL